MKVTLEQRMRQIANEQIRECLVPTELRDPIGRQLYVLLPPPSEFIFFTPDPKAVSS
jgi:hypothetical protein